MEFLMYIYQIYIMFVCPYVYMYICQCIKRTCVLDVSMDCVCVCVQRCGMNGKGSGGCIVAAAVVVVGCADYSYSFLQAFARLL